MGSENGRWEPYAPQNWRIVDANLPSVDGISFVTNAGAVFDQITQQWSAMQEQHRQSAVWDGRRHKWVLSELSGTDGCREALEKELRYLRTLHTQGLLTNEQFNKQAGDTWERYRHCL